MFKQKSKTIITVTIKSIYGGEEFHSKFEIEDEDLGIALRKLDRRIGLANVLSNAEDNFCVQRKKNIDIKL